MKPVPARGLIVAAQVGFALAVTQLPISLSLGVVFDQQQVVVRSLLLLLFPLAYACFGVGAAVAARSGALAEPLGGLRLGGAALLGLQAAVLVLPLMSATGWVLRGGVGVVGVLLGGWYFSLGLVLSRVVAGTRADAPGGLGVLWAVHLAGIVGGYLASLALVPAVGVHAVLVAVGLSALPGGVAGPALLALVLALAGPVGLDDRLEGLRSGPVLGTEGRGRCAPRRAAEPVSWSGWSLHAYVQLVHVKGGSGDASIAAYYNRRCMWSMAQPVPSELDRVRRAFYRVIDPEGPVVLVGVGGGRGLAAFESLGPHITAVEQDDAVVRALRDEHPAWGRGRLRRVQTLAADGRSVVERLSEPLAGLIVEGAVFQPSQAMIPASRVTWLYTHEAVGSYLDALGSDGLLVLNFNRVDTIEAADSYLLAQVATSLRERGVPFLVLRSESGHVHVTACPTAGCLARYAGAWSDLPVVDVTSEIGAEPDAYRVRDDTPFVGWATLDAGARAQLTRIAVGLSVLALLPLAWGRRRDSGPDPAPVGVALGLAHGTVVLAVAHLFRSYHGDSVLTVMRVYVAFALFGGLGALLSGQLGSRVQRPVVLLLGVLAAGGSLVLGLAQLPFGAAPLWAQEVFAALALAPFALVTGVLLPLALSRTAPERVGRLLLADALGTLAAAAGLYLVALPHGLQAWLGLGLVAYGAAAVLLGRLRGWP